MTILPFVRTAEENSIPGDFPLARSSRHVRRKGLRPILLDFPVTINAIDFKANGTGLLVRECVCLSRNNGSMWN